MNVTSGFGGQLSIYYSNPDRASTVYIYDGLNGAGEVLATLFLPITPHEGQPDPTGGLSPFFFTSVSFAGVARSVDFEELAHRAYVDNLSIGLIPEPSAAALLALGVPITLLLRRKRTRRSV